MENKITITTNISKLEDNQKKEIELSIGEFLASIMLERTKNTAQFDNEVVKSYLKSNK